MIALSIPFWVIGAIMPFEILPVLPISAFAFLCPLTAAVTLVYLKDGRAGVAALLKRAFDLGQIHANQWLALAFLLEPGIIALSFVAMRITDVAVPPPEIGIFPALALFMIFLISGWSEELGWSGYATDPLQERFGALRASLIIGLVWAGWHFIGLAQANRSLEFIAWWTLLTLATG